MAVTAYAARGDEERIRDAGRGGLCLEADLGGALRRGGAGAAGGAAASEEAERSDEGRR